MTQADVRSLIAARTRNVRAGISPKSIIHSGGMGTPQLINRATMKTTPGSHRVTITTTKKKELRTNTTKDERLGFSYSPYMNFQSGVDNPWEAIFKGTQYNSTPEEKRLSVIASNALSNEPISDLSYSDYWTKLTDETNKAYNLRHPKEVTPTGNWYSNFLDKVRNLGSNTKDVLTKEYTLRDMYHDVVGEGEPKTISDKFFGAIPWIAGIVGALVLVKVIK